MTEHFPNAGLKFFRQITFQLQVSLGECELLCVLFGKGVRKYCEDSMKFHHLSIKNDWRAYEMHPFLCQSDQSVAYSPRMSRNHRQVVVLTLSCYLIQMQTNRTFSSQKLIKKVLFKTLKITENIIKLQKKKSRISRDVHRFVTIYFYK